MKLPAPSDGHVGVGLPERADADLDDAGQRGLPLELNRRARTLVSPPGWVWLQATTKLPLASMATGASPSSRPLRLTVISGPRWVPLAL